MVEEYPIRASRFAAALREQRAVRLKGSVIDEEQTRFIYETRTVSGDALPVDDVAETMSSFELFDEMLDGLDEPTTAAGVPP